ncbi:MAG: MraY family glycosyltransferase, partial [Planctomycetota bacterium]
MLWLCLLLIAVGLVISLPITAVLVRLGHKLQTYDGVGVEGQVKAAARRVPNTGGIAIFLGVALPIAAGLALLWPMATSDAVPGWLPDAVVPHLAGVAERGPGVLALLAALTVLHVVGLIDDRRPLGPIVKLGVMLACIGGVMWAVPGTRLLVAADGYVGGAWLSVLVTVAWFVVVTNAMNFMDNMDGLAGGVTAVAGSCFLAATLGISQAEGGQWFVAAAMALLVGAVLGFLVFNRPKAAIFMGDGGSLVIGFLLAFLTVRTTYVGGDGSGGWYSVLMPLAV